MNRIEYSADVTVNVSSISEGALANLRDPGVGGKTLFERAQIHHSYSSVPAEVVVDQVMRPTEVLVDEDPTFSVPALLCFVLDADMSAVDFLDYLDGHEMTFDGYETTLVCAGANAERGGVEEDAVEDGGEQ